MGCWLIDMKPILFFIFFQRVSSQCLDDMEVQIRMHDMVRSPAYNGSVPPPPPVTVELEFTLRDVSTINENNRNVYFLLIESMTWVDSRLSLLPEKCLKEGNNYSILINEKTEPSLWIPSVRLNNAISVTTVTAPLPMRGYFVNPVTGLVRMKWVMDASFPCSTDYAKFPFDRISCDIGVGGWSRGTGFNLSILPFRSRRGPYRVATHSVEKINLFQNVKSRGQKSDKYLSQINLRRYNTYFVLQAFIPNILTVLVSSFSFLFPIGDFRISILLSTLILAALQYNSVAGSLPQVGYLKGVDVWFLGCLAAIFFCIIGNSLLCVIKGRFEKDEDGLFKILGKSFALKRILKQMDRFTRYFFFVLFIIFLAIYFTVFVFGSGDRETAVKITKSDED